MREILFRGKRLDNGKWETGNLIISPSLADCVMIERREPKQKHYSTPTVDADTIGQYSGLKDHEGTMMYEGDIVTGLFIFGMTVKGVVDFDNGSFGVRWWRGDVLSFTPFSSTTNITWKVIGNVHDNPEVME